MASMYASVSSVSQTLFHTFEKLINAFEEQKMVFFVKKGDKKYEFVFWKKFFFWKRRLSIGLQWCVMANEANLVL